MARLDEHECRSRVAGARVARLATIASGGAPDLVPIVYALVEGGGPALVSVVDHKPKSTNALRRLDNVRRDPRVTLLVDDYDEDWSRLWWVRVRARAEVVEPPDPRHRTAVDALVARYAPYRDHRPGGSVLWMAATDWSGWSAAG